VFCHGCHAFPQKPELIRAAILMFKINAGIMGSKLIIKPNYQLHQQLD